MKQESRYKIDCRFNKTRIIKSIEDLSQFSNQIELYNMDALDFLKEKTKYKRNKNTFVYIDPPYYNKGLLYTDIIMKRIYIGNWQNLLRQNLIHGLSVMMMYQK